MRLDVRLDAREIDAIEREFNRKDKVSRDDMARLLGHARAMDTQLAQALEDVRRGVDELAGARDLVAQADQAAIYALDTTNRHKADLARAHATNAKLVQELEKAAREIVELRGTPA